MAAYPSPQVFTGYFFGESIQNILAFENIYSALSFSAVTQSCNRVQNSLPFCGTT